MEGAGQRPHPRAGRLRSRGEAAFELREEAVDRLGQGGAGHRLDSSRWTEARRREAGCSRSSSPRERPPPDSAHDRRSRGATSSRPGGRSPTASAAARLRLRKLSTATPPGTEHARELRDGARRSTYSITPSALTASKLCVGKGKLLDPRDREPLRRSPAGERGASSTMRGAASTPQTVQALRSIARRSPPGAHAGVEQASRPVAEEADGRGDAGAKEVAGPGLPLVVRVDLGGGPVEAADARGLVRRRRPAHGRNRASTGAVDSARNTA